MSQTIQIANWSDYIALVLNKKLLLQYTEDASAYQIYAGEEMMFIWYYTMTKDGGADQIDFETNYKAGANIPLNYTQTAGHSQFEGRTIELGENDTEGYCEWIFDADVYINKALPIPIDAQWGDYIDFDVFLIDPEMSVSKYGNAVPLYGDKPSEWFQGTGAGKIPLGCKVRCTYHKAGTGTRKFGIAIEFIL